MSKENDAKQKVIDEKNVFFLFGKKKGFYCVKIYTRPCFFPIIAPPTNMELDLIKMDTI